MASPRTVNQHTDDRRIDKARPYIYAVLLMAVAGGVLGFADEFLARYALHWELVSLLVIAAAVVLWGVRPAVVVMFCSALFGIVIAPDLRLNYFGQREPWEVHIVRILLFALCGATIIRLAHMAQTLRETSERKRMALLAMQALAAPPELARIDGWQSGSLYMPARIDEEVGGDFYDVFRIEPADKRVFGVIVGDVMGKGKEAAVHTAMLRYTVRALANMGLGPAEVLRRLNNQVNSEPEAPTASLFFARICADTGCVEYASAGHEPPVVFRASGEAEMLTSTGPLIGAADGSNYEDACLELDPGARLLLFTDGVSEARDRSGRFLDTDGAIALFRQSTAGDPTRTIDEFAQRLVNYSGGNNRDDVAILLLQRESRPAPSPARQVPQPMRNARRVHVV